MATPIKQESCTEEDVKPCITSLDSIANLLIKAEDGSTTNPSPNNLPMKNEEGSNTNSTPNNNEEYCNGDGRTRSFTESVEEIGKCTDLNLRLTPLGSRLKDRLSSNRCPEISSISISTSSCMPVNNQDSSGEEVEFSDTTLEIQSLVVMGCSNCLMYVMVSEAEPKCPKCNTSVLIDIFRPVEKKSKKF